MGTKERREREREEIRTSILDAARELFAAEGYEAVTMRKIAERIEYSPTAIYLHFADKLSVLRALCDTDFAALGAQFVALAQIADPVGRVREAGRAYVDFGLAHPNHYRLMFMTSHPSLPSEDSAIAKGNPDEDAYAFLRAALVEAIAAGRLRPELSDPEILAQTIWSAVHGIVALQIAKGCDEWVEWRPASDRARLMFDIVMHGILVEER